jgi:hypothetical protein
MKSAGGKQNRPSGRLIIVLLLCELLLIGNFVCLGEWILDSLAGELKRWRRDKRNRVKRGDNAKLVSITDWSYGCNLGWRFGPPVGVVFGKEGGRRCAFPLYGGGVVVTSA